MSSTTNEKGLKTRDERFAEGRGMRTVVPRESHAQFTVDTNRDPLPLLTAGDVHRVPSLVPERYKRMGVNPFAFYRGAAAVMAHDLLPMPRIGLPVQVCGDCHLMNFGVFASPEGAVLFDINDFDETHPGVDFIVDLKRLVASVAVAAAAAGLPEKRAQALAQATSKAYRDFMLDLAGKSPLEVWETRMDLEDQLHDLDDTLKTSLLEKLLKAEKKGKDSDEAPDIAEHGLAFEDEPGKVFHVLPDGTKVKTVLKPDSRRIYEATLLPECAMLLRNYALVDVAFKVVGVGSVGTYCAVGLWATADKEQMILQVKQADVSAVAAFAPGALKASHQGKRVVDGQRAMQAAADPFLGWTQDETGRQFYVRHLKNRRLAAIGGIMETKALPAYATLCGRTLARAHARTGDPAMIAGYVGASDALDDALAQFAMAYARQTVADHAKLVASNLMPKE
ncbi:hypothetical protein RHAL1_03607 [Beijerinckiaceae bacterium RH AL1]|nr:DUF2252 domain-containing protein [Beijerinckiaceae bacterium]VVB49002.1 hypothetical protein RHCH11_RHCH11_03539 [Beijerinckiaceae bacterium RH CH11]VVB49081.1 hypothetical protein RHAL8_03535 [Beijerinckiaceae bacterium RH AL8]VVC56678.1 hypothetical protein RHAL1_03607 [Beijerinckiaceae bacterium RH AL1]